MSTRSFSLVCAVDLSEMSPAVILHALSEAHRHDNVRLHFLTTVEKSKGRFKSVEPAPGDLEKANQDLVALVQESLPAFVEEGGTATRTLHFHTRLGKADEQILELALEARADRIIVGRHSLDHHQKKLGGISAAVVNRAPCTVEVVQIVDYGPSDDEMEQCEECVKVRESSGGERWFCKEHSDGRMPRLSGSVGITSHTPGWGIF